MTPEIVGIIITVLLATIGFSVYCGKMKQQADDQDKAIDEVKTDRSKDREVFDAVIKEHAKEFTDVLKTHVEAENVREAKVETLKDELQSQIRETVKQEQQILTNQRQTEELKSDMHTLKADVHGLRNDVVKIYTIMEQVAETTKETSLAVQRLLRQRIGDQS